MILYLHGFRSSPSSMKARLVGERMAALGRADDYLCPQLPASPSQAMALALSLIDGVPTTELTVIGSSLGGYYATWLAERLGCRAVLLNPAIVPRLDLAPYVGVTTQYHSDQPFEFKPGYIEQLRALEVARITRPERYYLIAASGDEVLDYRDMVAHYAGARQHVIDGSDHAISEFASYVDEVLRFCGVDGVQ
ncbi:MAG: alpha/beta fold hydrolase [Burkholderiaceae bacterium]|nr:alpha/beta fold hydrolase [Burkholderiaceae bacterium]